jgi:hypothetical protein
MKTKLKPCPFCGKEPTVAKALSNCWRVQCWVIDDHMVNLYHATKRAAINAWNRRSKEGK